MRYERFLLGALVPPQKWNRSLTRAIVGTLFYCAPELLFGVASYTTKADIYSLGIVLWEIITR